MKLKISVLIGCMLLLANLHAQTTTKHRMQYFGSVQTGFQGGSSDFDISAQVLNGIQWKSWIVAVGTGYDGYGLPGIPVTLYAQKNFTNLKHKPFLYAQSGMSIPLKVNDWATQAYGKDVYTLNNGFTAEAGVGYQWKLGKKIQLVANTGFAYKHHEVSEWQAPYWLSSFPIDLDKYTNYSTLDYYYRRIVCRFGIVF
jgi:hypothetical protein